MEHFDPNRFLTLQELQDDLDEVREGYPSLSSFESVAPRTIRFYAEQGLLRKVARGRGKKYPADYVWRIWFIRRLMQEHQLKLAQIKEAMRKVDVETMRRVVTGEEPLEVAMTGDAKAVARHAGKGSVVTLSDETSEPAKWRVLLRSESAVLKVRSGLPPGKIRQLKRVAALIHSLLDEE
jgi:DNA-binding transcriptional MerR regulator